MSANAPFPLGVLGPSMPDARDRPLPVPGSAGRPSVRFLATKEQTFQGRQNSCLPHTVTQLMEDDIWMRTGIRTDLSIPFVYKEGRRVHGWENQNVGMWFRDAINVSRKIGVPPSVLMPYSEHDWQSNPSAIAYEVAGRNRAAEFYRVTSASQLMGAIASGNPVGVCLLVHENVSEFGVNGIWDRPVGSQLGAHALAVDGYDGTGRYAPDGDLWFLCKNWWEKNPDGSSWGIGHPLRNKEDPFVEHRRGRCWVHNKVIDSAAAFDMFAVLRFPLGAQ